MKLMSFVNKFFKVKDENKLNPFFIFLTAGVFLVAASLLFSSPNESQTEEKSRKIEDFREQEEKRLKKIICEIDGVKNAEVLISYNNNGVAEAMTEEKTVTRTSDSFDKANNKETQTEKKPVFNGEKNIIEKTQYMPEIKGVCIFYSGISDKKTEDKLYRAAKSALGAELYKIEVIYSEK